jgi:hypothetical protein
MKRSLSALVILLFSCTSLAANGPSAPDDQAAVLAVVQRFFDAMQARDPGGIHATWLPHSQYSLGVPGQDGYATKQQTIEALTAELMQENEPWLERMWSPTVLVAGRAATVWGRYDFHVGKKFSHNGTDCYTLLKTDAGW